MNAKRKGHGRRASDKAVTIEVDKPLDVSSIELHHLLEELNKGSTVRLAKQNHQPAVLKPQHGSVKAHLLKDLSFNEVVAMLGSGVALGVAALAVAPAASAIATVAAVVGVGIGGVVQRYEKDSHSN